MEKAQVMKLLPKEMDKNLVAHVLDKIRQGEHSSKNIYSNFLDPTTASFIAKTLNILRYDEETNFNTPFFYGGYEHAERTSLVIAKDQSFKEHFKIIRVKPITNKVQNIKLGHRDYLGSLMALGIKRECLGDILISDTCGDIIAQSEICEYILKELETVGRAMVKVTLHDIESLNVNESKNSEKNFTVSSLRLDSIIGKIFNMSREDSKKTILAGKVYVNHIENYKNDYVLKSHDLVTVRGMGRVKVLEIKEPNKKGKIPVTVQ